jgi:DNA mismatch endonuclease (patch repair protein)
MSNIRSKDTKPEMVVRKVAHGMGYRYRLHSKNLPGKPDLVFSRKKKVVFVHGCFWHMHDCPQGMSEPKTNADFWREKREGNANRDSKNIMALEQQGWKVLVLWECMIKDLDLLQQALIGFLGR